jgi:hypothetical protein
MIDLDEARQLSRAERTLLDFILESPDVTAELRAQGASALVVSTCECGCRSIGLQPADAAPDPRGDAAFALTADGVTPTGREIELTLHVVFGRMSELEIWDGSDGQGESRGELPDLATLRYREL